MTRCTSICRYFCYWLWFYCFKLVDKFVYQPMLLEGELSDDELSEEELKGKKSYAIFYKLFMKNTQILNILIYPAMILKDFLGVFLIEDTPLGVVKMYYSQEDESFIYWSNKFHIRFLKLFLGNMLLITIAKVFTLTWMKSWKSNDSC